MQTPTSSFLILSKCLGEMKSLLCRHFSLSFASLSLVCWSLLSEALRAHVKFSRVGNVQWENVECHQETVNHFMDEALVDCRQHEQYM